MSDLIDDPRMGANDPEFSVTEISGAIKRVVEGEFSNVRIRGEVGRVSFPRSGHVYLDLKDDKSVLSAVIWKGVASRLSVPPEEGMEVVASGRITTFGGQSKYQLVIDDIKPAGVGALMAMLEKRKAALAAEGLFDASRKRPLPYLPEVIGVITSPSGAVIRDILHRLRDRFPRRVLVWPVAVQGEKCATEVSRAIVGFNGMTLGEALPRPDVLIVARGGGSLEDLWGFNEEVVARAAAASDIPLISAVGHETDTTLIDFVSDKRAPTPTAAAELAVPVRHEILAWVDQQGARLSNALSQSLGQRAQRVRDISRAMPRIEALLDNPCQRLDLWGDRLPAALRHLVQRRKIFLVERVGTLRPSFLRTRIESETQRLGSLVPRLVPALSRGVAQDRNQFETLYPRLRADVLERDIKQKKRAFSDVSRRFAQIVSSEVAARRERLDALDRLRETLGYKETLRRGYAVVRDGDQVVTTKSDASKAMHLEIEFKDGRMSLTRGAAAAKAKKTPSSKDQGTLF